jgi:hypothetical protein
MLLSVKYEVVGRNGVFLASATLTYLGFTSPSPDYNLHLDASINVEMPAGTPNNVRT